MKQPNKVASYIEPHTGKVLFEEEFLDSELGWAREPKTGKVYLHSLYGGRPTDKWLKENPKPR